MNDPAQTDAALLFTCLGGSRAWTTLRSLLGTWDMLNVDVPPRETIERAAAPLVGSGFAEVRNASELRLTTQGRDLYRSVHRKGLGARSVPGAVRPVLTVALTGTTDVLLSADAYDAALRSYLRPRPDGKPSEADSGLRQPPGELPRSVTMTSTNKPGPQGGIGLSHDGPKGQRRASARLYRGVPAVILATCMATVVSDWVTGDPFWKPFPAAVGFTIAALAIWYVVGRLIGNETRRAVGGALDYSIRIVNKEGVEYREGDTGYEFWIGPVVDIPRPEDWDRVVPEAFRGRREEIVERMKRSRLLARTPFRDVFA